MRLVERSQESAAFVAATSVIAVGVGLAAMAFGLADPALRTLPYVDPDRLVSISFGLPAPDAQAGTAVVPSLADWQARTDLFVDVAAFVDRGWLRVRLSDRTLPLRAVAVTDNLLEVLGVQSRYRESDSQAAWISKRAAGLSGGELQPGRSVPMLTEGVLNVRSVLPDSFLLPQVNRTESVDVLVILPVGPVIKIDGTTSHVLDLVARIRPGVTPKSVEAALNASMAPVGRRVAVVPLSMALTARLRGLSTGAMVASGLIVLVCWMNVFSIALTRGLYRTHEIATRTALGASTSRILALLAVDGMKLGTVGTATALATMLVTLTAVLPAFPPQFSTLGAPSTTMRVVLFVVLGSTLAGVSWYLASLLAWKLGARSRALHIVSRDGRTIRTVRFVLIAGQLAAASVLLVGSALLARSYLNLMSVDSGLDDRTQTLTIAHNPNIPLALRRDVVDQTLMALGRASGVATVGALAGTLLEGSTNSSPVAIDGHWIFPPPDLTFVAGDFFSAMGMQFQAGGPPEVGNANAAVITESAARQFFGERAAVGATISRGRDLRIVGVVRDVRSRRLSVPPRPGVYVQAGGWSGAQPQTTYVFRTVNDFPPVASWEHIVRTIDPWAVLLDSGSIRARLDRSVATQSFATLVIGLFALSSLLVASLGLAGVVAYSVVKRSREIAIRLALGATAEGVAGLVVHDALMAATCGVAAGVIASVWLSHALASLLYGISAADPLTLLLTTIGLLVAVLVAAAVPALRVGRIAPAAALRIE